MIEPRDARAQRAGELARARRRAGVAKTVFLTSAALLFGVGMVMARQAYAGHAKHPALALGAPPHFVRVVKKNLLQAGVVGPAQAPPGATTAAS
jgi:hypothetical protein